MQEAAIAGREEFLQAGHAQNDHDRALLYSCLRGWTHLLQLALVSSAAKGKLGGAVVWPAHLAGVAELALLAGALAAAVSKGARHGQQRHQRHHPWGERGPPAVVEAGQPRADAGEG